MTGLVGNLAAAVLITQELFFLGGLAFIAGSVMDTLDGRYSRMSGKGTLFGAFLDSTLDRVEEGIVLTAIAWYFAEKDADAVAAAACVFVVLGSLMVSYTRARAEALGRRVQGRPGDPAGARRDPLDRPRVRGGRPDQRASTCCPHRSTRWRRSRASRSSSACSTCASSCTRSNPPEPS